MILKKKEKEKEKKTFQRIKAKLVKKQVDFWSETEPETVHSDQGIIYKWKDRVQGSWNQCYSPLFPIATGL